MCGIHLVCAVDDDDSSDDDQNSSFCSDLLPNDNVLRRGPDDSHILSKTYENNHKIQLQGSVLRMRQELVSQPVQLKIVEDAQPTGQTTTTTAHIAWNGEIYQMLDGTKANEDLSLEDLWHYDDSDTSLVCQRIQQALQEGANSKEDPITSISRQLERLVNAEYAIVMVTVGAIYVARDPWGRRSLLKYEEEDEEPKKCGASSFQLCSVLPSSLMLEQRSNDREFWTELPPGILFEYSFRTRSWRHQSFQSSRSTLIKSPSLLPSLSDKYHLSSPILREGVDPAIWEASLYLEQYLRQAVAMRMDHSGDRSTGVLFSGGIDSVVLAALAIEQQHEQSISTPVVLSNVSFGPDYEKSADRKAALESYRQLKELYPEKSIQYEDIVVSWEDIVAIEPHIRTLLFPKETIMDINIATALWFACRGSLENGQDATSPRVLLLGMGADEQMGGYGRHRKAFEQNGVEALKKELVMDQERLWDRNLGRDDRIAADHGKEARFPYLDVHVTKLLRELPSESICDFALPPGVGDKRILRLVAGRLGLDHASGLVKRAIQFGSRISHLSDTKRFGSRRKAKGEATA